MRFGVGLLSITLCTIWLFARWATTPMWMMPQGVTSGATPYEQKSHLITNCYPVHLVSPRWLPERDLIGLWVSYEVLVRTVVLFVLWFVAAIYLHIRFAHSNPHLKIRGPAHSVV